MTLTIVLLVAVTLLLDAWATVAIIRDAALPLPVRVTQAIFAWMLPLAGALLVLYGKRKFGGVMPQNPWIGKERGEDWFTEMTEAAELARRPETADLVLDPKAVPDPKPLVRRLERPLSSGL
jgi:hypothetical protein